MNERELDSLLNRARRAVETPGLPTDFACELQARLPSRGRLDGLRRWLAVLALLTPLTAVAGVLAVAERGERGSARPPVLSLYQGGGLAWKASR